MNSWKMEFSRENLRKKPPNILNPFEITPIIENILEFLSYSDLIPAEKVNREWRRATLLKWSQTKSIDFRRLLDSNWALAKKNTKKRQKTIEKAFDWLHKRCPNLTQLCDLRYLPWEACFNQKIAKFHCLTKLEIFASTGRESFFHVISMDFLVLLRRLAPNLQAFILHDSVVGVDMDKFLMELSSIFGEMKAIVWLEIYIDQVEEDKILNAVYKLPLPEKLEILKIDRCFGWKLEYPQLSAEFCHFLKRAHHLKKLSTGLDCYVEEDVRQFLQSLPSSIVELVIPNIGNALKHPLKEDVAADIAAEFHRLEDLRKLVLNIPPNPIFSKIILDNVTSELTSLGRFYNCYTLEFATRFKKLKEIYNAGSQFQVIAHLSKIESLEFLHVNFSISNLADFNALPNLKGLRCCQLGDERNRSHLKELCLHLAGVNKEDLTRSVKAVADTCPKLEKLCLVRLLRQTVKEVKEEPFQVLAKLCPKLRVLAFAEGIPPALSRGSLPSSVQVVSSL